MTAYAARQFAEAVRFSDLEAAPRWRIAFRSRPTAHALGRQARDGSGPTVRDAA